MNVKEQIEVIKEATEILRETKKKSILERDSSKDRMTKLSELIQKGKDADKELKEAIEELIKEAFMAGAKGRLCPRCNGSGRVD